MPKIALVLTILLLCSIDLTASPMPSSSVTDATPSICFLADGFLLTHADKEDDHILFGQSAESIVAVLGEPDAWIGFHNDLLWSYRSWGILLWMQERDGLQLEGIIISDDPNDNPHHYTMPIHFFHEAITWTHGTIALGQDLYQAQAIGKTFGSYRISQAGFRSHDSYLLIDQHHHQAPYVTLIAYSRSPIEALLKRYYPPELIYPVPY